MVIRCLVQQLALALCKVIYDWVLSGIDRVINFCLVLIGLVWRRSVVVNSLWGKGLGEFLWLVFFCFYALLNWKSLGNLVIAVDLLAPWWYRFWVADSKLGPQVALTEGDVNWGLLEVAWVPLSIVSLGFVFLSVFSMWLNFVLSLCWSIHRLLSTSYLS